MSLLSYRTYLGDLTRLDSLSHWRTVASIMGLTQCISGRLSPTGKTSSIGRNKLKSSTSTHNSKLRFKVCGFFFFSLKNKQSCIILSTRDLGGKNSMAVTHVPAFPPWLPWCGSLALLLRQRETEAFRTRNDKWNSLVHGWVVSWW